MVGSCRFERPRRRGLALVLGGVLVPGLAFAQQQQQQGPGRQGPQGQRGEGAGAPAGERAQRDDHEIGDAIHRAIIHDLGPDAADRLEVHVTDGVVTLGGTVDSLLARERSFAVAEGIRGVRDVKGRVEVVPEDAPKDGRIEADAYKALSFDPITRDAPWQVTVKDGVVTLGGTVGNYAQKSAALQAVSSLRGVRDVNDEVQVEGGAQGDRLQQALQARLHNDVRLAGAQGLQVTANPDGSVRIAGTVPSVRSRTAAREAALALGATSVDTSGLEVDPSMQQRGGALAGGAQPGQGRSLPAGARPGVNDQELRSAIEEQLQQQPRLAGRRIDVAVQDGRVRLEGQTETLVGKRAAEELVWNMAGVRGVDDAIVVSPSQPANDDVLEDDLEQAMERNALLSRRDVDVDVENGRVTLDGSVRSGYEKALAADIASRAPGVVEVDDELEIEGASKEQLLTDEEIKERIERQLFWSPFVSADKVAVTVENGVATLRGQVGSWSEVQAATDNALEGGARRVVNELTVSE